MDLSPIVFGPLLEDTEDKAVREMEEALFKRELSLLEIQEAFDQGKLMLVGVDYGFKDGDTTVAVTVCDPLEFITMEIKW